MRVPSTHLQGLYRHDAVVVRARRRGGGLTVNCTCASCLCVSLRAAGNSKTRPYRPPRGLKAQEVPEQHGLNKGGKKKHFKGHKGGGGGREGQRICAV